MLNFLTCTVMYEACVVSVFLLWLRELDILTEKLLEENFEHSKTTFQSHTLDYTMSVDVTESLREEAKVLDKVSEGRKPFHQFPGLSFTALVRYQAISCKQCKFLEQVYN